MTDEPWLVAMIWAALRSGLARAGRVVRRFRLWPAPPVRGPMRVCFYCKDVVTRGTTGRVTFTVCPRCEADRTLRTPLLERAA